MRRGFLYICMTLILMLFLVLADPLDQVLSQWLRRHSLPDFAGFMDRSIFEGEALGAGDFAVFLQITVLGFWLGAYLPAAPERLRHWRAPLGYILATSILTALWVHLSKGLIARPRPYELEMAASSWHGLSQRLFHGWGHGSFPSGHTANAISLVAVCYALHAMCYRKLALILGALVVIFAVSMALSRIMMGAHWPTDTLAAVTLGWFIAHSRFRSWQKKMENQC